MPTKPVVVAEAAGRDEDVRGVAGQEESGRCRDGRRGRAGTATPSSSALRSGPDRPRRAPTGSHSSANSAVIFCVRSNPPIWQRQRPHAVERLEDGGPHRVGDEEQAALPVARVLREIRLEDDVLEEDVHEVRFQRRSDRGARRTPEAVGADRVLGEDGGCAAGAVVADGAGDAGVVLGQLARGRVEAEVDVRILLSLVVENRLERSPEPSSRASRNCGRSRTEWNDRAWARGRSLRPARESNQRLYSVQSGPRPVSITCCSHADFPHQFDRRRVQQPGSRVGAGAPAQVDDQRPDVQPGQQQRAHEADRTTADDQHLRFDWPGMHCDVPRCVRRRPRRLSE